MRQDLPLSKLPSGTVSFLSTDIEGLPSNIWS